MGAIARLSRSLALSSGLKRSGTVSDGPGRTRPRSFPLRRGMSGPHPACLMLFDRQWHEDPGRQRRHGAPVRPLRDLVII
jgi:hypothetical protein